MHIKLEKYYIIILKRNNMKYLKIESGKGYYYNGQNYCEIDKIKKEDLLNMINQAEVDNFEIDAYKEGEILNKAQQIIYENIYNKFFEFLENKDQFEKETSGMYAEAIGKYSIVTDQNIAEDDFLVDDVDEEVKVENIPF